MFHGLYLPVAKEHRDMTQQDFEQKLDELDSLLNDPDVRLEPSRVWMLLAEVSQHDISHTAKAAL